MKTYTREQLTKAMKKLHNDYIENPEEYESEYKGTQEEAESSVDSLISFID